jgi:hypothetical protein
MIKLHEAGAKKHARVMLGKLMATAKQKYSWQNRFLRCSQTVNWAWNRWKRFRLKRLAYRDYIESRFSEALSDLVLRDRIAVGSEAVSLVCSCLSEIRTKVIKEWMIENDKRFIKDVEVYFFMREEKNLGPKDLKPLPQDV